MITVCHPSSLHQLKRVDGAWLVIDASSKDYRFSVLQRGALPKNEVTAESFHDFVNSTRDEFAEWIQVNLEGLPVYSRLLAPISCNPFLPFYREVAWACTAVRHAQSGDLLVVTRSYGLMKVLHHAGRSRSIDVQLFGLRHFYLDRLCHDAHCVLVFIYDFLLLLLRKAALSASLAGRSTSELSEIKVLVSAFLLPGDLSTNGDFQDRYLPEVAGGMALGSLRVGYYPVLMRSSLLEAMRQVIAFKKSSLHFIVPEHLVSFRDILRMAWRSFATALDPFPLRHAEFMGVDITELSRLRRIECALGGFNSLIHLFAPKALAERKVSPIKILRWFENQPIDHALIFGFKKFRPRCEPIAVRPYPLYSRNLLSYKVTRKEHEAGLVPREHWVGGSLWLKEFSVYDPLGSYKLVPNFRSLPLHRHIPSGFDGKDLGIMLPYSASDSVLLIQSLQLILQELLSLFSRIQVREHPANPIRAICRRHPGLTFFDEQSVEQSAETSLPTFIDNCRIIVVGGSSVALDSVSLGLPVILYRSRQEIDLTPHDFINRQMFNLVSDHTQLLSALRTWTPSHPLSRSERLSIGRELMFQAYEPLAVSSLVSEEMPLDK